MPDRIWPRVDASLEQRAKQEGMGRVSSPVYPAGYNPLRYCGTHAEFRAFFRTSPANIKTVFNFSSAGGSMQKKS